MIITALQNAGLIIADLSTEEGNLEDIFLELTRAPDPDPDPEADRP